MNSSRKLLFSLGFLVTALATGAGAHVALDAPNGNETFSPGDVVTIQWHIYIPHETQDWDLWYATDATGSFPFCGDQAGPTWMPILMDIPVTCQQGGGSCDLPGGCIMEYAWTIPEGVASETVKVRVRQDNTGADYYDVSNTSFAITGASAVTDPVPASATRLHPNEPNPFRGETRIAYALAEAVPSLRLEVLDPAGRLIRVLREGPAEAGSHAVVWDGRDREGRSVPNGAYFCTLAAGDTRQTRRLLRIE
jgi:hypothetical protein